MIAESFSYERNRRLAKFAGLVGFGSENLIRRLLPVGISLMIAGHGAVVAAQQANPTLLTPVKPTPNLYHSNVDANKEIQEAVKRATNEHKRVILVFGANWCYDCHVLDKALHEGEAGKIVSEKYLLVHVDIGEGEKNPELVTAYKIPLDKGVPAVAILDADGTQLYSSGEGEFEAARRMLKKDLVAFLNRWKRRLK